MFAQNLTLTNLTMMQIAFRPAIIAIALLTIFSSADAQPENLARDSAFFRKQIPEFQRWLDHSGLGRTLHVRECEADTLLKVYLGFQYKDVDSIQNAWETLKIETERRQNQSLEALLFFRAMGCFDVDRDHLSLRIYDTYDLDKDFCFKRKIYSLEGQIKVDSISKCRGAKKDYVPIQPGDLSKFRSGQKCPPIAKRVTKAIVFEKTKAFFRERYATKTCALRRVRAEFTIDAPNLDDQELVVINLCDEIIREDQPGLCQALQYFGHDCNWKKNEKITIRLTYRKNGEGFILDLSVEGRYGAGPYETEGRRGYHDMETDFDPELSEYTKRLAHDLNRYLLEKL